MMVALGRSPSAEYKDNLHQVIKKLRGEFGLLFINHTKEEVNKWFIKYMEADFVRADNKATFTMSEPGARAPGAVPPLHGDAIAHYL
ncbi:mRNA turnover protein 4-like protein [Sciurus carolinensis]|uniref:mRNA turnover protein 4-like protein n=1 Tax=Sciurus carolinensis TaxID=30640 RepID=A0AA41NF14_SCICA|nr:mRNA turnover protein 4-like protein [Sciurus carolinensis]